MKADVLIIGGGFAGATVAQELEKRGVKIILVDKKDYFEVTFATLRNITAPEITGDQPRQRYQDFLSGRFVQSSVVKMTANDVLLANGDKIEFAQAVIASGTRYPTLPIAKSEQAMELNARNKELYAAYDSLKKAQKVLVIGGGVVGVELAGEIAYAMPDIEVTLAHGSSQLLDGFKPRAQKKSRQQLEKLGVKILFNSRFTKDGEKYIDENSGNVSDADAVFVATGVIPNSGFMKPSMANILNDRGFVNVNEYLEVKGYNHLYALGDIADVGEAKLGYLAAKQGVYLARMIADKLSQAAKGKSKSFKAYSLNPLMALIPVGQKQGVVQLPFAVTTNNCLMNIKQKDLFVSKVYKGLGTLPVSRNDEQINHTADLQN